MLTVALFTTVKIWKQLKCPLIKEWIKKMWCTHTHTHTMEYYSAIKKNEIMSFVATWVDLEIVILSEVGQTKEKYNIPYMWNLKRINANELISKNYLQI